MGLKVWLPLNGDLHNQGTSNPNISLVSGNTWASSGKIGSSSLTLTKLQTILSTSSCMTGAKEVSYAYWVKVNTAWSANWLDGIRWIETNGSATSTARQQFYTNCTLIGTWYKGGSISGKAFTPGVWTHLAATFNYNTGEAKFYINGILSGTTTNVDTTYYCRGDFYIGDNGTDICENDVRIYDHCLSAAEVREISQGLVLHYKLDASGGSFANPNLLTGNVNDASIWTANQCTKTQDGNAIKAVINSTTGDRRIYLGTTNVWTPVNSTFTVSFDAKAATNNLSIRASRSNITGTDSVSFMLTTGWKHYSGIIINSAEATGGTLSIQCTVNGGTFWVRNVKLERGNVETRFLLSTENANIIQDSSGYNHNGTITGDITLNSNTPRYSASSFFNGTERVTTTTPGADIRTLSCWCKTTKDTNTSQIFVADSFSGMCISFYKNNVIGVFGTTRSTGSKSVLGITYKAGEWNHIAVVKTGNTGTRDIYCNGIKLTPTTDDYWGAATGFFVGAKNASNTNPYYGYLSDVRAYVTELDADAIRQLYEVGAKVDNKNNVHSFELNEDGKNEITKRGQLKCSMFTEFAGMSYLKYDPNLYIEPDGSCWVHIFHQNNPASNLFSSTDSFATSVYKSENAWFNIELCNYMNSWEFLVETRRLVDSDIKRYRWIQNANPMVAVAADVAPASVVYNTNGYDTRTFGGIYKTTASNPIKYTYLNTHDGNAEHFYGTFGQFKIWNGGITGQQATGTDYAITTGYVDLYVRIDSVTFSSPIARTTKNNIWAGNEIIEF